MSQSPRHLFVATPAYGGQASALYMRSVLKLRVACNARGIGVHVELGAGEALIGRGRAALMARFLKSPASDLLFIDADIGFEPEAVFRLLATGKPVVGGVYPSKHQPAGEQRRLEVDGASGRGDLALRQVDAIGTGFLLISRRAAQQVSEAYPELKAKLGDVAGPGAPEAVMVFDSFIDPKTGRYLNDYQAFCYRWRAIGGEVWADFSSSLDHVGAVVHSADRSEA